LNGHAHMHEAARPTGPRIRLDPTALCLLALAAAALLYGVVRTWPRTVDDAYITFRYARNLAEGMGPIFNAGERVEGCSSPSWMLLLAAAIRAGLDPVLAAKVLGVAASLALLIAVFAALRGADVTPRGAALSTLVLGSSMTLQIWTAAGMATTAYAFVFFAGLLLLAAERPSRGTTAAASTALVLAALTRPEGLAFWVLGLAVSAARAGSRRRVVRTAGVYAIPGLALASFFAWRFGYYGFPFPNTYYAKTGASLELWRQGWHGVGLFVMRPAHTFWIVAAILGATAGLRSKGARTATIVVAGATVLHLLWAVSVGGDGLRVHRFQVPVLAPLAFLVGMSFRSGWTASQATRRLGIAGAIAAILAMTLSEWALHSEFLKALDAASLTYQEGNERLGRYLARTRSPDTRIAVAAAGAIPYYSGLQTIDMYGLNDAHIAHEPFPKARGSRLMKWDNDYVLSLRPDLIVINRGYVPAGSPLAAEVERNPGILARSPMTRDLFRRVEENGGYALHAIALPEGGVFYVFESVRGAGAGATTPRGS
jgi:arabinofuranosyltransferase